MESIAGNSSNVTVQNSTCYINQEIWRDAIVIVRLVISGLSIGGALSIIATVLVTRTFKKQTIHPLLALSIADLILSLLYVAGGGLWLGRVTMDVAGAHACILISRLTLITAMAALCTQLIYGALAYLYIKKTVEVTNQPLISETRKPPVSCGKVSIAYMLAWAIPIIIVAIPFIALSVEYDVRYGSFSTCSWCLPNVANVIPYTFDESNETQEYMEYNVVLHLSTTIPLFVLTSFIFVALVSIYFRTWCFIKNKKNDLALLGSTARNQELQTFITNQRKSFRRIIAFMTYFIILLAVILVITMAALIYNSVHVAESETDDFQERFDTSVRVGLLILAVVIPLQGFVNAVIFGWSRPTFLSGLSESLRRPPPIILERRVSLRRDYSPTNSGSIGRRYSTLQDIPEQ